MACYKLSQSPHQISKGLDLGLPRPKNYERGLGILQDSVIIAHAETTVLQ